MDLERLRLSGVSQGRLGLLTNRIRPVLWRLLLPYFEGLAREIDALRLRHTAYDGKFTEVDSRIEEAVSGPPLLFARVGSRLAGVQKDLAATGHRLSSIEARLDEPPEPAAPPAPEPSPELLALLERHREWLGELSRQCVALENRAARLEADAAAAGRAEDAEGGNRLRVASGPAGRFMARPHDLIGGLVLGGGVWEPHIRQAIERHAQPGRAAIDAGAYIGLHSVHMSRFFREVRAFEPQREIFQVLCGNLALNECRNVTATNAALYDRACTMRLAAADRQQPPAPAGDGASGCEALDYAALANAAALVFEVQEDGAGPVRAVTVDSLGVEDVGFIKVDTQGADLHVLRGAVETIRRCRPVVVFEYERDMAALHGTTQEDMLGFFDALGYRTRVLHATTADQQLDYIAEPA